MKTAPAALITLLNNLDGAQAVCVADLYTLTLLNGTVLRYTSADIDIKVGSNIFTSRDLKFERSKIKWSNGIQVDEMDITLYGDASNLILGQPFVALTAAGGLDGATLQFDQAFMSDWSAASGDLTNYILSSQFVGRVSDVECSRNQVKVKIKSLLEFLNIQMPRNVYIPPCIHTLYDSGCALNKASFSASATVTAATASTITVSTAAQADGYFDNGFLTWLTGGNAGTNTTVKSWLGSPVNQVTFGRPLLTMPTIGDTLTLYAGCDKLQSTCQNKFSNLVHFRGFPYIPAAELSVV